MKMQIYWKSAVGCLLLGAAMACTDTKEVVLPQDDSMLGLMGFRGRYAKVEQPYQVSCPLWLSEHAQDVQVAWSDGATDETIPEDERGEEVSYKTFVWHERGPKMVECRVGYTYGGERKELVQRDTIGVVPPVYGQCFFGDSLEKVKALYPDMELLPEAAFITYVDQPSETEFTLFSFQSDLLMRVETMKLTGETLDDPYHRFLEWVEKEADEYTKMGKFDCHVKDWEIPMEDQEFAWEVHKGKELTEADIERLNRLLNEGAVDISMRVTCDYLVYSHSIMYSIVKYGNGYNWSKQYNNFTVID